MSNLWPWTNLHELNLDWIIQSIKDQETRLTNFVSLNTIKYADPFQWSITRQYAQNTLVIDPSDGTAYLSIKPVPLGVQITNEEYWTPVFTLQNYIDPLKAAICRTIPQQEDGQAATQAIPANSLFFVGDTLCTNSAEIPNTSLVIIGSNCQQISVEELLLAEQQAREQADEQLGQQITQEQQAREQADSQLSQQITQEQTAREEADTQLQTKITAEQTAREQADSQLSQQITAEQTAREQADNQLSRRIDAIHMGASIDLSSVLFFGDSYVEGWTLSNPANQNFCTLFANMLHINSYQRFYAGGSGFAHVSASTKQTFQERWISISGSIQNPTNVTTIFFMGGINDGDTSSISGDVANMFSAMHNTCPNAVIYFMFNPAWYVVSNATRKTIMRQIDNLNYVRLIDSWWWLLYDTAYFSDDMVHPNAAGHEVIAYAMATTMQGGIYSHYGNLPITLQPGYNGTAEIYNDLLRLYLSGSVSGGDKQIAAWPENVNKSKTSSPNGTTYKIRRFTPLGTGDMPDGNHLVCVYTQQSSSSINIKVFNTIDSTTTPPSSGGFFYCDTFPINALFG